MTNNYWLSPLGNDANPGTRELPFQTLERARDAVRDLQKSQPQDADITVWLQDGTYRLSQAFVLTAEDSGQNGYRVIYKAVEGTQPNIAGSIVINNWEQSNDNPFIYKAAVPQGTRSRQLYVNGRRANRASTTAYPEGFVPIYAKGGICYVQSVWNNEQWRDPSQWQQVNKIQAVLETQWKMMSVPLQSINNGLITLQDPAWENANLYHFEASPGQPASRIWSFWRVTRFENALAFLTDPGEWYLDEEGGFLYYMPQPWEDMNLLNVELPVLEQLIIAGGDAGNPITHITFEGLSFAYATWMQPDSPEGYVADQSGYRVMGTGHTSNITGHVKEVIKTPGNIQLSYAQHTRFLNNNCSHMGAVALDYGIGSQHNTIKGNTFFDISSAAIQLGDVYTYTTPLPAAAMISHNTITLNQVLSAAVEFVDAAGIFAGFTEYTTISYNTIKNVHWSGIAMGWGWGLLDPDGYPGISGANWFEWGKENYHTINRYNKIVYNHIENFLLTCWDGGAIYTTGYQGTGWDDALLIQGNTAMNKNPRLGGNVFYTDGGSRWIILLKNNSVNNPVGYPYFGPLPLDPLVYILFNDLFDLKFEASMAFLQSIVPYGGDIGGCRTYGDIEFIANNGIVPSFYDICGYTYNGVSYPKNMLFDNNNQSAAGTVWGGASYPPVNEVNSWYVPRISLPGILAIQPDYISEWWYYVGVIYDEQDTAYSVMVNLIRWGHDQLQAGVGILGLGWKNGDTSSLLHGLGIGIGASQTTSAPSLFNALSVYPVTDSDFQLSFLPMLEFIQPYHNLSQSGISPNTSADGWNIAYTGGNILGAVNATYTITGSGKGYIAHSNTSDTASADYELSLSFTDRKGMVMENKGGVVGNSYECALPVLEVQPGGQLSINGTIHTIKRGTLWMDRQLLAGTVGGSNIPLTGQNDLLSWLLKNATGLSKQTLYTGNWMGFTLYNGLSLVLAAFWAPHKDQWLSGTGIGNPINNPQPGGFGNLYLSREAALQANNAGQWLRPRFTLEQADNEWDYDINLLDTTSGGIHSPHWTSPQTGFTYASAWHIEFSPLLQVAGLPQHLYLFVLCENAEIIMTDTNAYFEGAAFVYDKPDKSGTPIGHAFVEQMGYN